MNSSTQLLAASLVILSTLGCAGGPTSDLPVAPEASPDRVSQAIIPIYSDNFDLDIDGWTTLGLANDAAGNSSFFTFSGAAAYTGMVGFNGGILTTGPDSGAAPMDYRVDSYESIVNNNLVSPAINPSVYGFRRLQLRYGSIKNGRPMGIPAAQYKVYIGVPSGTGYAWTAISSTGHTISVPEASLVTTTIPATFLTATEIRVRFQFRDPQPTSFFEVGDGELAGWSIDNLVVEGIL